MLNRFFGATFHTKAHLVILVALAASLAFSKAIMSICMMLLALNLLLEADFKRYWQNLTNNRGFHLIAAFFLLHLLGLLWTNDLSEGMKDIRIKLPLIAITTAIFAKPPSSSDLRTIYQLFIASVLVTSVYNFMAYQGLIGKRVYDDIRGMSLFASHVRYGLLVVMAFAIVINVNFKFRYQLLVKIALGLWFAFYTYYSQVLSGVITLSGVMVISLFYELWKRRKWLAISFISATVLGVTMALIWLFKPINFDPEAYKSLPIFTAEGNYYYHNPKEVLPETGKPIEIMICWEELRREWEKVSLVDFEGKDQSGHLIKYTLIRYLASLDLNKDAIGFSTLTEEDIRNVEKGYPSKYHSGVMARVYSLQYELNNKMDPNGHTLLERIEYWKHGLMIAKEKFVTGVGTGDSQSAFNAKYQQTRTSLIPENWHRAHNMFLTIVISLGVLGLFLFLWIHTEFIAYNIKKQRIVALSFIVIMLLSYTVEDTLETQTGITFFALFFALFMKKEESSVEA